MTNKELLIEFIFRMDVKVSFEEKLEAIDCFTNVLRMPSVSDESMYELMYPNKKLTKLSIQSSLKDYLK